MPSRSRKNLGSRAERLLLQAETEYIADPQRRSLEYWYDKILVNKVAVDIVRRYALENKWAERRQSFWRGVQSAWLKQRHVQLVQQRSAELHQAVHLRAKAYELIVPKVDDDGVETFPIAPKSWEGAVRAFCSLDDMVETKREKILENVEPMMAEAEETTEEVRSELPFSKDEMREIAHNLLAQRRKRRRLELGIDDEDEDDCDDRETEDPEKTGHVAKAGRDRGGVEG